MTKTRGRVRMCVGCRAERPKSEMVRVVRGADGVIAIDSTGRMQGRGAYICHDPECLRAAIKKKALSRALKHPVGNELYAMIEPLCGAQRNASGQ